MVARIGLKTMLLKPIPNTLVASGVNR